MLARDLPLFLQQALLSACRLPVIFARAHLTEWGAGALVLTGNMVIFETLLGFVLVFGSSGDIG